MASMPAVLRKPHRSHRPAPGVAALLAAVLIAALGEAAPAATNPTTVKPTAVLKAPVQSAATGSLKTSREALLKQRSSVTGLTGRHPGKIVGATMRAPKTIVTKRFLPK